MDFLPVVKFEIMLTDGQLKPAIDTIIKNFKTARIGDGKIFVSPMEDVLRIRTDEHGDAVI